MMHNCFIIPAGGGGGEGGGECFIFIFIDFPWKSLIANTVIIYTLHSIVQENIGSKNKYLLTTDVKKVHEKEYLNFKF